MKRQRAFIVYPFLVAVYSVLTLASANFAEVWLRDLTVPLAISLWVATVAWLTGRVVTRNRHLGGMVALAIVAWFIWYHYIRQFYSHEPWLQPLSVPRYAVPLILLSFLAIPCLIARRCARRLPQITRYLNVTAGILVVIPAVGLIRGWDRGLQRSDRSGSNEVIQGKMGSGVGDADARPDIYVIILDKYTGARSLRASYGYDNSAFEDSLTRAGFFVPSSSHSNCVHTPGAVLDPQLASTR